MPEPEDTSPEAHPEKINNRKPAYIFSAIFLLAILCFAAWLILHYKKSKPVSSGAAHQQVEVSQQPTFAQDRAIVDARSKLVLPEVAQSTLLDRGSLPTDIASFILPDATDVVVSNLSFVDSTIGYRLSYSEPATVPTLFYELANVNKAGIFARSPKDSVLDGASTDLAATLEQQNEQYSVKIQIDSANGSASSVVVTIVKRKQ